jgi:hypothetical protein
MTPDEKREQEVAAALEFQRTYKAELLKAQLQAYMERRIRETGTSANNAIIELIGGASEAEIETSIVLARSEFNRFVEIAKQQLAAQQPQPSAPPSQPVPSTAPIAVQVQAIPSPSQFPRPVSPPAIPEAALGTQQFTEQIAAVTTPEAVRNGTYAQHRRQLMATLQQQGQAMGSPQWHAPRNHFVSTVQQPQALPMPQPQVPQQNFAPPVPQNLPPAPVHMQQPGGVQPPIPQAMQPQMTTPAPVQPRVLTARTDGLVPRLTQDELSQQVISLSDVRARALASAQQQLRGAAGAKFVSRDGTEANRALAATQLEMTPDGRVAHGMNRTS